VTAPGLHAEPSHPWSARHSAALAAIVLLALGHLAPFSAISRTTLHPPSIRENLIAGHGFSFHSGADVRIDKPLCPPPGGHRSGPCRRGAHTGRRPRMPELAGSPGVGAVFLTLFDAFARALGPLGRGGAARPAPLFGAHAWSGPVGVSGWDAARRSPRRLALGAIARASMEEVEGSSLERFSVSRPWPGRVLAPRRAWRGRGTVAEAPRQAGARSARRRPGRGTVARGRVDLVPSAAPQHERGKGRLAVRAGPHDLGAQDLTSDPDLDRRHPDRARRRGDRPRGPRAPAIDSTGPARVLARGRRLAARPCCGARRGRRPGGVAVSRPLSSIPPPPGRGLAPMGFESMGDTGPDGGGSCPGRLLHRAQRLSHRAVQRAARPAPHGGPSFVARHVRGLGARHAAGTIATPTSARSAITRPPGSRSVRPGHPPAMVRSRCTRGTTRLSIGFSSSEWADPST
jgi:hypothetical protein